MFLSELLLMTHLNTDSLWLGGGPP